jgi:hypothetical protein
VPNCAYTVTQAATELVTEIYMLSEEYPGVQTGLIEPIPSYSVGVYPANAGTG